MSEESLEHSQINENVETEGIEKWVNTFPDEQTFSHRLEQLGVSRKECEKAIRANKIKDDEPLPDWTGIVEAFVERVLNQTPEQALNNIGQTSEDGNERLFPELSAAIAGYARDQLPEDVVGELLSPDAIESVIGWFRRRFEQRFVRILFVEFKAYVAAHDERRAFADPEEFDELPTEYYDQFIDYLFNGGIIDLCQEYPLFARLVALQVTQLNELLREFCHRVQADRDDLAKKFNSDITLGCVSELEPLAEDTHGDGRAVMRIEFESGLVVAYKPRSVEAGSKFYDIVSQINTHTPVPDLETPEYLVRDEYGWMEWIDYEECASEDAVRRYYERAGALLCIAYFLEFSDCQVENLIVSGESPVLVDAETVLQPYIGTERRPMQSGVGALQADSVLLTLLLPFGIDDVSPGSDRNEMMEALSGFGISDEEFELADVSHPLINAPNTDLMSVQNVPGTIERSENIPRVDGEPRIPDDYVANIVDGFEATYRTVLHLKKTGQLTDDIGLPDALASTENRIVYRATMEYMDVIRSLFSRETLRNGALFGVEIERLAVPFCDGRVSDPKPWPLYEGERTALKRLDPPRFTSQTDDTEIRLNGTQLNVDADITGIDRCRARLRSADEEDMHRQIELIRGCFGAVPAPSRENDTSPSSKREYVKDDELIDEAKQLFERVQSAATRTDGGTYHWSSIAPWNERQRLTIQPAKSSLYIGRCGIGLLGAGLYELTGEEVYRTFTLKTIQPVRKLISSDGTSSRLSYHGGATGVGSVAYGLGAIGSLLNEQSVLDDAVKTADFVTDESIARDDVLDVNSGAAGSILGLLALYDRTEDEALVTTATTCGDHLLDARVTTSDGLRVWKTVDDCPPLTGFAHGVGGIAYALSRLADVTGRSDYRDAVLQAVEYESKLYSRDEENWADPRPWASRSYLDQWCYGRSGIGLSRLGMARYIRDSRITRGLDRAIDGISSTPIRPHDHLCCGEAGRAEFLLEAHKQCSRLPGEARSLLGGVYVRKQVDGYYRIQAGTNSITDPSFFRGISGIAYSLLRITSPETLPCILLWE